MRILVINSMELPVTSGANLRWEPCIPQLPGYQYHYVYNLKEGVERVRAGEELYAVAYSHCGSGESIMGFWEFSEHLRRFQVLRYLLRGDRPIIYVCDRGYRATGDFYRNSGISVIASHEQLGDQQFMKIWDST